MDRALNQTGPPPKSWAGWWRRGPGRPWHRLTQADTWDGCWTQLLDLLSMLPAGDSLVSRDNPNDRRP